MKKSWELGFLKVAGLGDFFRGARGAVQKSVSGSGIRAADLAIKRTYPTSWVPKVDAVNTNRNFNVSGWLPGSPIPEKLRYKGPQNKA